MNETIGTGARLFRRLMAAAAAVGTAAALCLPAVTMEQTLCGMPEHVHEDVCYVVREVLSCRAEPHSHTEQCVDDQGEPVCGQEDFFLHSHAGLCFDASGNLWCELPQREAHTHDSGCCDPEDGAVQCGKDEWQQHIHTETCFDAGIPVCGSRQLEVHIHNSTCMETETVLSCDLTEHSHEAACYPAEESTPETEAPAQTETEPTEETAAGQERSAEPVYTAAASPEDKAAVSGDGIRFRLFNYSKNINKDSAGTGWRPLSHYFTFRGSGMPTGELPAQDVHIPAQNINAQHDADGFTASHATVERLLQGGVPVLDLTRNADGTLRTDPGVDAGTRNLGYLFRDSGDPWVTAYSPGNTILQKDGNRYWYDSRVNAVDYDTDANLFRIRSYPERNSTTAGYGSAYGDFLPFNYTGGVALQEATEETAAYHLESADADYWFGMSMEVSFYQSKDGRLGEENMVFRFSGDDDVWVFVDDVLVLDLGGTHGTVEGSVNFATGEILQYLTWNGANATAEEKTGGSSTSFPTTLRACFDAAGKTPSGGWEEGGETFADYTRHTLTFFYLERGAAVANCKIDFRLPTLPDKSLTVTKELTGGETADFIRDSLAYSFRVLKTDEQGTPTGELYLQPGMGYTLLENGSAIGSGTVSADGTFSLKAGQSAQFADMLAKGGGAKHYVVQEIMPDRLTGQYETVEYSLSGDGGTAKTEEGPTVDFTAFETDALTSEQTQIVIFRNKVDIRNLSRLQITKRMAEGSTFAGTERFPVRVTLGGNLLPVGTAYQVGEEIREVESPGILLLGINETAELLQGILSGTAYEVTELETQGVNCRPSYSGTVSPEGEVRCSGNGAEGIFPLSSLVEITVTNASYDYSVGIPISKQAQHNTAANTFAFRVWQARQLDDGSWQKTEELPGTDITVTDDAVTGGTVTVGFNSGFQGTCHFWIAEAPGSGNFLYDNTFYIVQITASQGTAQVTGILKNGVETVSAGTVLAFVNRRVTDLRIEKTVQGGSREELFSFTASVKDGETVTVTEFALKHGQTFVLPNIPWGAEVTVTEGIHSQYLPSYQLDGVHQTPVEGNTLTFPATAEDMMLRFRNRSAYELPKTGGRGTEPYTLGGLLQMAAASCLLYCERKREKGDPISD